MTRIPSAVRRAVLLVAGCVTVDLVLLPGVAGAWVSRVATLVAGTLILALGVALYLAAGLGAGPFESLTLALRPLPFRAAFVLLQAIGVVIGLLLHAPVGPGSLVIVFCVGPLVALVRPRVNPGLRRSPVDLRRRRPPLVRPPGR